MILYVGKLHEAYYVKEVASKMNQEVETLEAGYDLKDMLPAILKKNYSYVFISVENFINPVNELIETVKKVQVALNAQITIIAKGYLPQSELVLGFYYAGFTNFILSTVLAAMKDECEKCLTGHYNIYGVPFEVIPIEEEPHNVDITLQDIEKAKKRKIKISVAGSCSRIGTTTQALQICKYISLQGYKVCYIEMNSSMYFQKVLNLYSEGEYRYIAEQGLIKFNNLDIFHKKEYLPEILRMPYDYYIYDFGCFLDVDFNKISYLEKDINIVVGGAKANEIESMLNAIQTTIEGDNSYYIFSFTDQEEREDILSLMEHKKNSTSFAEYTPNPFVFSSDSEATYKDILDITARETVVKQKKKKFFWGR